MDKDFIQEKALSTLAAYPMINLIYLFGSQVSGKTGPLSDVDLGILVDHAEASPELQARLAHELAHALGTSQMDVLLLNRAPIELTFTVISRGQLLYQRSLVEKVEYEATVMSRYYDFLPVLRAQQQDILQGDPYGKRAQRYREALGRTERTLREIKTAQEKPRTEFDQDPFLKDIVERNLEVAARCLIDICNPIISLENAQKPVDYHEAITRMGELGVLPPEFAQRMAPIAGFQNILIHEYLIHDWDQVYINLQKLDDLERFAEFVKAWMRQGKVYT